MESHLAFADDIVFFCRVSHKSMWALREVLDEFTVFSELRINCGKSFAIFSKKVTDKAELAALLEFQVSLTGKLVRYMDCDNLLTELLLDLLTV